MNKKVVFMRCDDYHLDEVKSALNKSIEYLGGLDQYLSKGEKVLLKVNLLMKKKPEEATTTHPVFVKALTEILMEFGVSVLIGDSPGGPFNEKMLRGIYLATGMQEVAQETGAQLNTNYKFTEIENPNGLILKRMTVTDMIYDVDKVISVSKLKTHGMMTFTGAVKNMFGIIPGIMKAEFHVNMPAQNNFADALVDICLLANPVLSFMDGIVGMEGEGPSAGNPRSIKAVIASDSPYHLDKAACHIVNLDFSKVYTIDRCVARGLCSNDLSDIDFFGDNIESFKVEDFIVPETKLIDFFDSRNLPKFIKKLFNKYLQSRPVFNHNDCISCNICKENCPAKVIEMDSQKKPSARLEGCIRCYCCQELCPKKAVTIYRPKLMEFIARK